jgi:hypothetical protein
MGSADSGSRVDALVVCPLPLERHQFFNSFVHVLKAMDTACEGVLYALSMADGTSHVSAGQVHAGKRVLLRSAIYSDGAIFRAVAIGAQAFRYHRLPAIFIPRTVSRVEFAAFSCCRDLRDVVVDGHFLFLKIKYVLHIIPLNYIIWCKKI